MKICSSKNCPKDKILQPLEQFGKSSYSKDGLRSNCKTCDRVYREENRTESNKQKKLNRLSKIDYYLQTEASYGLVYPFL